MKRFGWMVAAVIGSWLVLWQIAAIWPAAANTSVASTSPAPEMERLEIAPRNEALTFARFNQGDVPHLLLVTSFSDGKVTGLDIQQQLPGSTSDPISVFNQTGYSPLEALAGAPISVARSEERRVGKECCR